MNQLIRSTRREFLRRASGGFGALALAGLCHETHAASTDPLAPRPAPSGTAAYDPNAGSDRGGAA